MSSTAKPSRNSFFKRLRKWGLWTLVLLAVGILLGIYCSPYGKHDGFSYKLMKHSVVVNVPVDSAFSFLGKSSNAKRWSVYVDHISTLNGKEYKDGTPGSKRRCFCYANEKGQQWDELITLVETNKRRQLTIHNMVDFPMQANGLASEQRYRKISENQCEITFTIFFADHNPGFWDEFKTYFGMYKAKSIFEQNLNNIKRILETGN